MGKDYIVQSGPRLEGTFSEGGNARFVGSLCSMFDQTLVAYLATPCSAQKTRC